jgi:glycosyltransferase involved in cell wall biosynthesis
VTATIDVGKTRPREEIPAPVSTKSFADLAILIPALNEEAAIGVTLRELRAAVPDAEILLVDDGSSDNTLAIAREVPGVEVLVHRRNRGYGASLKTAARMTSRPVIAWYDADGQHRPEDLINVVAPLLDDREDMVIGVRGKGSAKQRDRAAGKLVLYLVARIVSGEAIPDLNSGLRAFRRDLLLRYLHLLPDGFSASTTSTLVMLKAGHRVGYVPIVTKHRLGKSSVKMVRDGMRTLHLIVRIVVLFEALKIFTALGLMLLVPGLIYGLVVAFTRREGFPTLAETAVLAGLLTFFMGIIADQVVELRKERFGELTGRPGDQAREPPSRRTRGAGRGEGDRFDQHPD